MTPGLLTEIAHISLLREPVSFSQVDDRCSPPGWWGVRCSLSAG
jgi:hypothetical protein